MESDKEISFRKSSAEILQRKFNLEQFRTGQEEIIESILQGKDVVAVLPTGGGKSLCYQFVAVWTNKLVIVISPLISLMQDQVRSLQNMKIRAGAFYSGQSKYEKKRIIEEIEHGGAFVLYLSPERIQKDGFKDWMRRQNLALFAVDEAHCISQWGHDFRQEYRELSLLKSIKPEIPVLVLTASATPIVLEDIEKQLKLDHPQKKVFGFYRPNLYFQVENIEEKQKMEYISAGIQKFSSGRIIIYCATRKAVEDVAILLSQNFSKVGYYHAGLDVTRRMWVQKEYEAGRLRILVATNAFGMGVDQPDVRLVVHFNMPGNLDSLLQEMGRAGRDGLLSTCLLLFSQTDQDLQSYFIYKSSASEDIKKLKWNKLEKILSYTESGVCRHSEILTYYQEAHLIKRCGHCDTCDSTSDRKILIQPKAGFLENIWDFFVHLD